MTADHPTPRLTGHCVCCGADTRSLFAMGHDARFRGFLIRALAAGDWTNPVSWFTDASQSHPVPVDWALVSIRTVIGRDWTEKVVAGASRLSRKPVRPSQSLLDAASQPLPVSPSPRYPAQSARPFEPTEANSVRRVDVLLDALSGRPLTGQWGYWRPSDRRGLSLSPDARRFPARVQLTRRDSEQTSLIDLLVVDGPARHLVTRIDPSTWTRDESAREL